MSVKRNLIIFEGHDMVGKTTIAKALGERLNLPVLKVVKTNKWHDTLIDLLYGVEIHVQTAEQTGINLIYDRLFPSEYAYANAYNRITSEEKIFEYDRRMAALGAKIIVCYKLPSQHQEDDQGMIDVSKYDLLTQMYQQYAQRSCCQILFLDTGSEDLEDQLAQIIKFLE